jgi:hypothetical protein
MLQKLGVAFASVCRQLLYRHCSEPLMSTAVVGRSRDTVHVYGCTRVGALMWVDWTHMKCCSPLHLWMFVELHDKNIIENFFSLFLLQWVVRNVFVQQRHMGHVWNVIAKLIPIGKWFAIVLFRRRVLFLHITVALLQVEGGVILKCASDKLFVKVCNGLRWLKILSNDACFRVR